MVHYTETCESQQVSLITPVHTPPATVHDSQCTALIQAALSQRHLLPSEHIVDAAYVDADLLVSSTQDHGITLVGPARRDPSWHAKQSGAYAREQFFIDWERRQMRCPQGKWSSV
jgi:transposase